MLNKIVKLTTRIVGHSVVESLEFREPRWDDIMACGGEPYVWTRSPDDPRYVVPSPVPARVKDYAERLIARGEGPGDPLLLSRLGIRDTLAVQDAILDFFLAVDPRRIAGSTTSSETSSSSASGTPASSDA